MEGARSPDVVPAPPAAVRPLERPSTSELVSEHLRRRIFDGRLRPGDRIQIDQVAAELGVSRLPVREALHDMARDGLITVHAHRGAYVGDFDDAVLRDHFEIVGLVQGLAAVRLAGQADAAVLDRLAVLVDRLARTTDPLDVHEAVMEFHRVINVQGGSARQRSVLRALGRMLPTGFFAEVPGAVESGRTGAARILAAIRSGDEEAIRQACLEVQRARADLVVEHLEARGVFTTGSRVGGSEP